MIQLIIIFYGEIIKLIKLESQYSTFYSKAFNRLRSWPQLLWCSTQSNQWFDWKIGADASKYLWSPNPIAGAIVDYGSDPTIWRLRWSRFEVQIKSFSKEAFIEMSIGDMLFAEDIHSMPGLSCEVIVWQCYSIKRIIAQHGTRVVSGSDLKIATIMH